MKLYTKPVITIDSGLAEGVYAASGSSNGVRVTSKTINNDWGSSGQATFSIDLSNVNPSQLTVIMTFNMDITNGWGGGASAAASNNQLTLNWYSAPATADISVQANGNIKQLECTGTSYSNN